MKDITNTYKNEIILSNLVPAVHYSAFKTKALYNVMFGSRRSGKSTLAALLVIYNIMRYPWFNCMVLRSNEKKHRKTTHRQLLDAMDTLKVTHLFHFSTQPNGTLDITYKPTGQQILFAGIDTNADGIKSTKTRIGGLFAFWIEEASEIKNWDLVQKAILSFDSTIGYPGAYTQVIISTNPSTKKHWLYTELYNRRKDLGDSLNWEVSTVYDNPYIDNAYIENLKKLPERQYKIQALGEWDDQAGQLIYPEYDIFEYKGTSNTYSNSPGAWYYWAGLDDGFSNDPAVFTIGMVNYESKEIYVFYATFMQGYTTNRIVEVIKKIGYGEKSSEPIHVDSASPRLIGELRMNGLNVVPYSKRKGERGDTSLESSIRFMQEFKIYVNKDLEKFRHELDVYGRDENGTIVDKDNHGMDSFRYGVDGQARTLGLGT